MTIMECDERGGLLWEALAERLYITKEEALEYADLLRNNGNKESWYGAD